MVVTATVVTMGSERGGGDFSEGGDNNDMHGDGVDDGGDGKSGDGGSGGERWKANGGRGFGDGRGSSDCTYMKAP